MVSTFMEVEEKVLKPLLSDNEGVVGADDLLPVTIFVTIKARCALYRSGSRPDITVWVAKIEFTFLENLYPCVQ